MTNEVENDIQRALNKEMALGCDNFEDEMETLLGRRVRTAKVGRPELILNTYSL